LRQVLPPIPEFAHLWCFAAPFHHLAHNRV
jgi:hypothetical protein